MTMSRRSLTSTTKTCARQLTSSRTQDQSPLLGYFEGTENLIALSDAAFSLTADPNGVNDVSSYSPSR